MAEVETAPGFCVWIGAKSKENFRHSAETFTWGFREHPDGIDASCKYVIFGTDFFNGENHRARSKREVWEDRGFADLIVCEVVDPIYMGSS